MNKYEKIKTKLLYANWLWEVITRYCLTLKDKTELIGIRKLSKELKLSKNTTKKYVRLALKSKIEFFTFIVVPHERNNSYPLQLSSPITQNYVTACKERSDITKGHKTRITFKYFIENYSQEYKVDGIVYKPKWTYIINSIKSFGCYSQLCTHHTKQSARFKKTKIEQKLIENKTILKQIGLEEELKFATSNISKQVKNAPSRKLEYLPGQRVEIDASKEWWGLEQWTVYTIVDSSTGFKVAEHIEREETNLGYLRLLTKMFERYGKPSQIVTDRRRGWDGKSAAQLRDIVEHIGIKVFTTSDPNGKPKVERSFRTMENDFYYMFLKENDSLFMHEALKVVDKCADEYNERYNKELDYEDSLYLPLTDDEWNTIKVTYECKIKSSQIVSLLDKDYALTNSTGDRIYFQPGPAKIYIDHMDVMYVETLNYRLFLDSNALDKKIKAPTRQELLALKKHLSSLPQQATKQDIDRLIKTIDKYTNIYNIEHAAI